MKVGTTPAFFMVVFDGSALRVPTNVTFLIFRRFSSVIVASLNFRPVVTNTGAFCELANANAEMAISGSASTLTKIALCEVVQKFFAMEIAISSMASVLINLAFN